MVLVAVQYPDPITGNPSSTLQDKYKVDALGEVKTLTDRNSNTHTYSYDVLAHKVTSRRPRGLFHLGDSTRRASELNDYA